MKCRSCGKAAAADAESSAAAARICEDPAARQGCRQPRRATDLSDIRSADSAMRPDRISAASAACLLEGGTCSPKRRKREVPELFAGSIEPTGLRGAGFRLRFCVAAVDGILLILLTLIVALSAGLRIVFSLLAISLPCHSFGVLVWPTTAGKRSLGLYVRRSGGSEGAFRRAARRWFCSSASS